MDDIVAYVEDTFAVELTRVCINFEQKLQVEVEIERSIKSPYLSLENLESSIHLGASNKETNEHTKTRRTQSWKKDAKNHLSKSSLSLI